MSPEMFFIFVCSVLGLIAHGSRKKAWLAWIIRGFIFIFAGAYVLYNLVPSPQETEYTRTVNLVVSILLFLILWKPFRSLLSKVLTVLDGFVSLRALTGPLRHKMTLAASLVAQKIYQEESIPHMNGLFCFIVCFGFYVGNANLSASGFAIPGIPLPMPITLQQLFEYNGLGLITVSAFGCGLLVSRKFKQTFVERLGWQKPSLKQLALGIGLIFFSFFYDWVWSLFTHSTGQGMAGQISAYNAGAFHAENLGSAALLAIATALCAGIGEETLVRGAFQPVIGILPAALLHGVMHGQFAQAPILILQVALWSCCMGIARRFTNTTTTIIGHAGYNLCTTFLFAFNP